MDRRNSCRQIDLHHCLGGHIAIALWSLFAVIRWMAHMAGIKDWNGSTSSVGLLAIWGHWFGHCEENLCIPIRSTSSCDAKCNPHTSPTLIIDFLYWLDETQHPSRKSADSRHRHRIGIRGSPRPAPNGVCVSWCSNVLRDKSNEWGSFGDILEYVPCFDSFLSPPQFASEKPKRRSIWAFCLR